MPTGIVRKFLDLKTETDASVLGRCLIAMGAPHGVKISLDAVSAAVWVSPKSVQCRFVEIYVTHRGSHFETKSITRIQEDRPASPLEGLHDLIAECVDGNVSVGERAVIISADAARELGFLNWPLVIAA